MAEDVEEKYRDLLREVTSFSKVRQELVVAKQRIDLELERYEAISEFNQKALQQETFSDVRTVALESIIEAFQLEFSIFFSVNENSLVPMETFGIDLEEVGCVELNLIDISGKRPVLVDQNDNLVLACSCMNISQAVYGGIYDSDGVLTGIILSGITTEGADFYEKLTENILNSYSVILQQIGAIRHVFFINEKLEEKVRVRTETIVRQKEEITDSINYAFRIQNSMLGDIRNIESSFQDAFVFFRPKDIVSGDFYWFSEINNFKVIIAADCTGHGVPGAFMTVLGNALLNVIVNEHLVMEPGKILTILDKKIRAITQKQSDQVNDGMDMAILVFDEDYQTVRFSGAKNPLVYVRGNEIVKVKGSRDAIGGSENMFAFETHQIDFQPGDMYYIFSDGFQDQFCKEDCKKYKTKRFYEFLGKVHTKPGADQLQELHEEFITWKGSTSQTDDVLVIGVRT